MIALDPKTEILYYVAFMDHGEVRRIIRGRPKSENKKLLVSVRYSPEVVAYFKSTGEGWQSRMDGVLRQYVARHSRSA